MAGSSRACCEKTRETTNQTNQDRTLNCLWGDRMRGYRAMRFVVRLSLFVQFVLFVVSPSFANPPVASYLFPAGGQRGTTVKVRVGGLFLYNRCGFEMLGPGVEGPARIERMAPLFFEGPLLPLPESQQAEDYPQDF